MKKKILLALLAIGCLHGYAQEIPEVIPPAPNAAALGKFADIPVSLYTGTPQISVPIWEITEGTLSVPISLSYHAGGIRVSEIASWVGLGWALNSGGVISRSMNGLPDDKQSTGFLDQPAIPQAFPYSNSAAQTFKDYAEGAKDSEPDMFYFNMPGYSGKFMLDKSGQPHLMPYRDIDVEITKWGFVSGTGTGDKITEWTVTVENGTKYIFGAWEKSTSGSVCETNGKTSNGEQFTYVTSWFLTKIVSANDKWEIDFEYEDYTTSYEQGLSETTYQSLGANTKDGSICTTHSVLEFGKRLKKITFTNGSVEFIPGSYRCDITSDKFLDEIQIKDANGAVRKKFNLSYHYMSGSSLLDPASLSCDPSDANYWASQTPLDRRLMLTGVVETDISEAFKKGDYKFEYYLGLPDRLSPSQDYWGYYNGISTNTLIPQLHKSFTGTTVSGANRRPSETHAEMGTMKKITYPTGGFTEFEYELHRSRVTNLQDQRLFNMLNNRNEYLTITSSDPNGGNNKETIFNVNDASGSLTVDLTANNFPCYSCPMGFEIIDENDIVRWNSSVFDQNNTTDSKVLPNGMYTVRHTSSGAAVTSPYNLHIFYTEESINDSPEIGGLRLSKIIESTSSGNISSTRTFSYNELDQSNQKIVSGVLISVPKFAYEFTEDIELGDQDHEVEWIINSSSNVPLGSTQGSHVGYKKVTVIRTGQTIGTIGTGKTEYTYSVFPNSLVTGNDYATFDFGTPQASTANSGLLNPSIVINKDWSRGQLKNQTDYKKTDQGYQKVREVINNYEYGVMSSFPMMKAAVSTRILHNILSGSTQETIIVAVAEYDAVSEYARLKNTKEIFYDQETESSKSETFTENLYTSANHQFVTEQKFVNSLGDTVKTFFKYPLDYSSPSTAIDSMISRHILAPVIEQTKWVGDTIFSGTATKYKYDLDEDHVMPEKVYVIETDGITTNFTESIDGEIFNSNFIERADQLYDSKGNLIQFRKTGDVFTSYVWGYNQTLPVAQISGASYEDVKIALGGDSQVTALQSMTGTTLKQTLDALRNHNDMKDALITTFTYDPIVGMISSTDPNGITTTYEYDELNRLRIIKDHEGNIVQHYDYHYYNEASNGQGQ
ncbi:RHS repeat protein [Fulvivirgaceae bacterium BMA10]|uniref:RHS repeat protein n=1 Tax=Splendidivirga corallicola TaxID=3051826 RepID=A0ABT8KYN1_9BACT|nr:RHS repeat protein [Fulvivirgaceae bacterium BMA10]